MSNILLLKIKIMYLCDIKLPGHSGHLITNFAFYQNTVKQKTNISNRNFFINPNKAKVKKSLRMNFGQYYYRW